MNKTRLFSSTAFNLTFNAGFIVIVGSLDGATGNFDQAVPVSARPVPTPL